HTSDAHAHMANHDEPELVSRPVQAGLCLFVSVLVYSVAFWRLFWVAFLFSYGRTSGALTPPAVLAFLAAAGARPTIHRYRPFNDHTGDDSLCDGCAPSVVLAH